MNYLYILFNRPGVLLRGVVINGVVTEGNQTQCNIVTTQSEPLTGIGLARTSI